VSTQAASESQLAELAVVRRSGFTESRHFGSVVGVDADGGIAVALGDVTAPMLPRSALKPIQALGCLLADAPLDGPALAIAAGSHTGQDEHVAVVRSILAAVGLPEEALRCVPSLPEDAATRHRLIARGEGPSRIRANCSGKHAAMLAACVANSWPVRTYLDASHPLQQLIRDALERAAGEAVAHVAVDGCGTPVFGISLVGLARAARSLATAVEGTPQRAVADAMRAHPECVGGTGHANTDFMRLVPGTLCKGGAEGVIVAAAGAGQAVAVKVIDGSDRATTPIALAVLGALGVDTSAARRLAARVVLGGGVPVGEVALAGAFEAAVAACANRALRVP
jgi:L-asparaginase II